MFGSAFVLARCFVGLFPTVSLLCLIGRPIKIETITMHCIHIFIIFTNIRAIFCFGKNVV
jgi:hypothetical protein